MQLKRVIQRPFTFVQYNVTLYLIVINLVVFFVTTVYRDAFVYLAMNPLFVNSGYVWSFFTYMFVHGSVSHVLFNMISLFLFGTQVEQEMGSWEFLLFYLVTGVLAGLFSYAVYAVFGLYNVFLVGASGAVYGIMLAFATYYPNARIFLMGILPVRSLTLVIFFAGFAIVNQLRGSNASVAHATHLAGLLFAVLYFPIRLGENPINRWRGYL